MQNLGTGVRDFFYEPLEGMSEGSLEAFLSGLGKGVQRRGQWQRTNETHDDIVLTHLIFLPSTHTDLPKTGTNSLVGNTMESTFTAASKITGTLGHGLASLTLDKRYNHDRARRRAHEAQNVSEGIKQVGWVERWGECLCVLCEMMLRRSSSSKNTHTYIAGRA